jgi:urease accessory protein
MNLNDYGNFVSSSACHSERSEESLDCSGAGRKKTEMFRFAQHDQSKKLSIELYQNLTLHCSRRRLLVFLLFLWPITAFAHTRGGEAIGFVGGFEHPISGWDHVLAMVAVGLWGAQLGPPAVWLLPVTFPMVMAFGGMLGLMGVKLPGVEVCIALSAIALGLMVLREAKPNLLVAAFLVGFFAIFHGHAHGTELPPGANGLLYSIGFVIATGLLHATGIAIGTIHRWPKGRVVLRLTGAVVMAGGAVFLWGALT